MEGDNFAIVMLPSDEETPRAHIRNSNVSGNASRKAAILDLAKVLEDAVCRINFFRHKEKDSYPPILLTPEEDKKPGNAALRERLGRVCPEPESSPQESGQVLERLKQKLGPYYARMVGTDRAVSYAYRAVRFEAKTVKVAFAENDVDHTIALCNLMARSSLVAAVAACAASEMIRAGRLRFLGFGEDWQNELVFGVVGKVAELAYGSPYLKLGDTHRKMVTEGPRSKENLFMKMGLAVVMNRLFIEELDETEDLEMHFVYRRAESEWREAAVSVLEELSREFGFSFHSMPGILDTFERINGMDFVSKENLPIIAAVWGSVYSK
jgi:hypothetical protein